MRKDPQKLAQMIKDLIDELASVVQDSSRPKSVSRISEAKKRKGASGALSLLIDERFFDTPQDLNAVMNKMAEIGRYYTRPSIAMNLLNSTKRRTLVRLKGKGSSNWKYVVRK
jgi:LDH2 family malate/lactate/ureidoglycolate dehydrogenase